MPYSCTVLCGLLPCVNLVYSVKIFMKEHVTSPQHLSIVHIKTKHALGDSRRHPLSHLFISSRQSVAKKKLLILGWQALKALQSVGEKKSD